MRRSLLGLLPLSLAIVALPVASQAQGNQTTLQPGTTLERTIGPSESHTFTIDLDDEQYLQFVVNQKGVDLLVRVFSPSGKNLGDFDTPNGADGPENVAIVGLKSGSYRIVVAPLNQESVREAGRYEIKTIELRQATEQELKVARSEETRKAKGVALLNDIIESIPEIRLPLTRLRVKLQSANLLWNIDEKKATRLLTEGMTEAQDYLASLKPDDYKYEEAYQWVRQLRFEAVQSLALRDPEAALNLFRSTRKPLPPDATREDDGAERQLEMSLAGQVAARNPKRAYEFAEESLKSGLSVNLIETLTTLRRLDQELANSLAKDVLAKLNEENLLRNTEAAQLALNLIRTNREKAESSKQHDSTPPLITDEQQKALVQKVLSDALSASKATQGFRSDTSNVQMLLMNLKMSMGKELDTIVPGSAQSIQKKLEEVGANVESFENWRRYDEALENPSSEESKEILSQAPPEIKPSLVQRFVEKRLQAGEFSQAKEVVLENITNPRERRQALNNLERQAAYSDLNNGRIEEALKHASRLAIDEERGSLIGEIALRIGPGQKRTTALALLETARSLLGTSIRADSQTEMFALLQLSTAFSKYDAKRSFEILEPLVDQFNDLSEAAKTLNGFGPMFFIDGELSMQNGNSLASLAPTLASTLGVLSMVDFDRTKAIADRLHLPEVRVGMYLSIAQQSILPNGPYSPSAAYVNTLNR
jgi:hypothetical protein